MKMRSSTADFISLLILNTNLGSTRWNKKTDLTKVYSYLSGLPDKIFKDIVSDPMWNRYPSYVYSSAPNKTLLFGSDVAQLTKQILLSNSFSKKKILLANSVGLFAIYTLDYVAYGTEKKRLASRVFSMKDLRLRKRALKALSSDVLKRLLAQEKNSTIREMIIAKIGPTNVGEKIISKIMTDNPQAFKDHGWNTRNLFLAAASTNLNFIKRFIDFCHEQEISLSHWSATCVIESFLQQCSDTDLIFYANLGALADRKEIKAMISHRLSE